MKSQENQTQQSFEQQNLFGKGSENKAYAAFFTGNSYLNPLTQPACGLSLANVTFEPGCRNHWHIHHASSGDGQILICTSASSALGSSAADLAAAANGGTWRTGMRFASDAAASDMQAWAAEQKDGK